MIFTSEASIPGFGFEEAADAGAVEDEELPDVIVPVTSVDAVVDTDVSLRVLASSFALISKQDSEVLALLGSYWLIGSRQGL